MNIIHIIHNRITVYLVIVILFIVIPANGNNISNSLEGCVDPDVITKALIKLHNTNWQELTLDQLWEIWPTELSYDECYPAGCKSVWSMDRIINGTCQCCAIFYFKKQGTEVEPQTKWLRSLIIYYASDQRSTLIAVAKKFAGAFGLKEEDLKTIGQDSLQNYGWETVDEVGGITISFEKVAHIWLFDLNASQNIEK